MCTAEIIKFTCGCQRGGRDNVEFCDKASQQGKKCPESKVQIYYSEYDYWCKTCTKRQQAGYYNGPYTGKPYGT